MSERSQLAREVTIYLRERPDEIIPHAALYEAVWGVPPATGYLNTLRSTISLARLDLSQDKIHSVYGVGYFYLEVQDGRQT